MSNTPAPAASSSPFIPPQMMMWVGMYAVVFTIVGGMVAYMCDPNR